MSYRGSSQQQARPPSAGGSPIFRSLFGYHEPCATRSLPWTLVRAASIVVGATAGSLLVVAVAWFIVMGEVRTQTTGFLFVMLMAVIFILATLAHEMSVFRERLANQERCNHEFLATVREIHSRLARYGQSDLGPLLDLVLDRYRSPEDGPLRADYVGGLNQPATFIPPKRGGLTPPGAPAGFFGSKVISPSYAPLRGILKGLSDDGTE